MKTRACVLHGKGDVRIETREIGNVGPKQVRVRIGAGGLCGSDIHYFWDGGIGTIQVSEPIILGHEVAGTIEAVGGEVTNVKPGGRVALCPSLPCGHCCFCQIGQQQHCLEMQFFGSAMRKPHCDGGFRDEIIVEDFRCEPVGDIGLDEAACADAPLAAAIKMGATSTVNARCEPDRLALLYSANKGYFDAGFECTGVGVALGNMFPVVKPRGVIVAVGVSSGTHIPFNALVGKEIRLAGTHRFHAEYPIAARMIAERRIDVRPIITATLPMDRIRDAFDVVRDRSSQMKVQLSFAT